MRTLYDPEKKELSANTFIVLAKLQNKFDLYLISRKENHRMDTINNIGIKKFFKEIHLVDKKNKEVFYQIGKKTIRENVFVIGDRIPEEIKIANLLGYKTIWYQKGKFSEIIPQNKEEEPWQIIHNLLEIERHLT